jgi:uncharacterized protein (TIGR02118 family)
METFKVVRMVKRGNLRPAEFRQEFLEKHRELKRAAKRVVASVSTGEVALGGNEAPFDGMAALYYSSAAEARHALGDDPAKVEVACSEYMMSQKPDAERTIKGQGQLKIIRTVIRRKDLTLAQFKDYWLKNHSKLEHRVIAESPVVRIVASFALPPEPGGNEPHFDGMVELYFSSTDDIRAMFAGPIPAMMRKDEENFVQMDAPAIRLVAEEFVL